MITEYKSYRAAVTAVATACVDACPQAQWAEMMKHFNANNFVTQVAPRKFVADLDHVKELVHAAHPPVFVGAVSDE